MKKKFAVLAAALMGMSVLTACSSSDSTTPKIAVSGVLDHSQWETNEGAKRSAIQMIANNIEFIKTDGRGFTEGQDQGEETPF